MTSSFDLDPVLRITAGAVGEPGQRTFFIQARGATELVTLLAEKQQVQVLATTLSQLLESVDIGDAASEDSMELEEPLIPEWRVGPMAIEVDEDSGMLIFLAEELLTEEEEAEGREPAKARFVATPGQMRALADHADRVCAAGRPRCQLCGFPLEPEGHACPATNGHRKSLS